MTSSTLATLTLLLLAGQPASAAQATKPEAVINLNLAGLSLNAAVEALSLQSGAVFVVAANSQEVGPDVKLRAVPLSKAVNIVASAYGVCADARAAVTSFRDCRAWFAHLESLTAQL